MGQDVVFVDEVMFQGGVDVVGDGYGKQQVEVYMDGLQQIVDFFVFFQQVGDGQDVELDGLEFFG